MYNLKMIHSGNEIYTKIPYYISDGRTNKLRSNLLFPFICFNNYYGKDCPINYNFVDGGLIKYHTIESFNVTKINDSIISKLDPEYVKTLNHRKGVDIISVLPRIGNLLDFLICINNPNIINYDISKLKEYHPIENGWEFNGDKFNGDHTFDMRYIETKYNKTNDLYKNELLLSLQSYIVNIKKLDFIKYEPVDILFDKDKIVSKQFFNSDIIRPSVCYESKVSIINTINTYFYSRISEVLAIEMKKKLLLEYNNKLSLHTNLDILKPDEKQHINFLKDFSDLINETPLILSLTDQLNRFQTRCYKNKYLKYKKKYLSLKDNIK
jgi:hypothetical protein